MNNLCIGDRVHYIRPVCADDVPVRTGEITDIYDDGYVSIDDDYIGDVTEPVEHVFTTEAEAEDAWNRYNSANGAAL